MIMKKHIIRKAAAAIMSVAALFSATAVPTVFAEPVELQIHDSKEMDDMIPDGFIGDTDGSRVVDVSDATRIQLHISPQSAANVLTGMPLRLADVNDDGRVDVTDATMVQLYSAGENDKAGKTGMAYLDDEPADGLRVKVGSNLFPAVTRTFSADKKQVTVTFKVNISEYQMINTQWNLLFDHTKLHYDEASNKQMFPMCMGGSVVNDTPEKTEAGYIIGNASNIYGYYMDEEDGSPTVYTTFTFDVIDGASGTAYVYFELVVSQFLEKNADPETGFRPLFIDWCNVLPELAYLKDRHTTEVTAK